jgi:Leu/Phe-tRNA-protein transferase
MEISPRACNIQDFHGILYIMKFPRLRYTPTGHVIIFPKDDLEKTIDILLDTNYSEEFCFAGNFGPSFTAALMAAGFLIMSAKIPKNNDPDRPGAESEFCYILLPKLHLIRSVLFFPDLHIKKSVKPLLSRYELRVDGRPVSAGGIKPSSGLSGEPQSDFDRILDRCVEIHGADWLTPPLLENLRHIRADNSLEVRPISFGLYRDGELKAGEFGVRSGRVYTSYSGYYDEDSAGTVQMTLMSLYLRNAGFAFLDLGMPLKYKNTLGAQNIDPRQFIELFRAARV